MNAHSMLGALQEILGLQDCQKKSTLKIVLYQNFENSKLSWFGAAFMVTLLLFTQWMTLANTYLIFVANVKEPLVFWNKKDWGATINGPQYCEYIVRPHLHSFWQDQSRRTLDYVYLMHDGVPPHHTKFTTGVLCELSILDYFFA